MDNDLIKLIITEGKSYAKKDIGELTRTEFNLTDPETVRPLADILTEILITCQDSQSNNQLRNTVENSLASLLYSWCQISEEISHDICNERTLQVLINIIKNEFPEVRLTTDELRLHRENLNNWEQPKDVISISYKNGLQRKREENVQQEIWVNKIKEELENTLIPVPHTNKIIPHLTVMTENTKPETLEKIIKLGFALINLKDVNNVPELLTNITSSLLRNYKDLNQVENFFKTLHDSTNDITYIEYVPVIIETEILNFIFTICNEIQLPLIETNQKNFIDIKNKVYELLSSNKPLLKIFTFSSNSKIVFQTVISILNQILIQTKFDLRILAFIQNFIDSINSAQKTSSLRVVNLYPEQVWEIVTYLDLSPSMAQKIGVYETTLEKLFELYLNSSRMALMLVSHYYSWIDEFHKYFCSNML